MNPSPDRGKECLPPKKRESRQGSTEHHVTLNEFKPPVPLRSRSSAGGGEGGRKASDKERSPLNPSPQLLHTPPPLPVAPPGLHLPLPWHLSYSPSVSLPLFQGQLGERRGSRSPAWRDDPLLSPLTHHSQWFRGEAALSLPPSPSSSSSFKTPFPADCREMGSYINSGRHDNSSSLFSPSYTFSHSPFCSQDPSLLDVRHRYSVKRPNGLDGPGSRTAQTSRTLIAGEYGNDSSRTRLDVSPHGSQSNGGRRQQEDPAPRLHSGGAFFSDCQALEGPEPHSSQQDRQIHGISKSSSSLLPTRPHPIGLVPRAGRGSLLDPLGVTPAEAQIYYSLGSVCQPSPQAQAYPLFNPSGTPLYNLHREQGPRLHSQRNSPNSPLGLPNNHDRLQRDKDRDKVLQRDEERDADQRSNLLEHKDQDQHSDQHRRQERERDRGRELSPSHTSPLGLHPPPPPLLPHFTKGSLIELASGRLKRVEELQTEDFLRSADTSPEFHLSTCTVLLIYPSVVQGFSHLQVHLTDLNTQVRVPSFTRMPNPKHIGCCTKECLITNMCCDASVLIPN